MPELTVIRDTEKTVLQCGEGRVLADVLAENGFGIARPCGGRGVCGKCAALLSGAVSAPNDAEQKLNTRLMCQARILGDAAVRLPQERVTQQIETGSLRDLQPLAPMEGDFGATVDIGTTTLALKLYDLRSGRCIAQRGMLNPQTSVAADVMGRIGTALRPEGLTFLCTQVTEAISALLSDACACAGVGSAQVSSMVVTGNTTMLYLLTGRSPEALSHAPFAADHLFDETVVMNGKQVYLPGCMHAFVGADITCSVLHAEQTQKSGISLLCDAGTNGELALWKQGELLVTSTAAGPAFEGAGISCGTGSVRGAIDRVTVQDGKICVHTIGGERAVGVCGSGLIDAVAAGLKLGLIDETGAMEADELPLAQDIALQPKDIRAVQLAKAAIAAGVETLLETAHVQLGDVETLYIAGGFGSHMNTESAADIGLFPRELIPRAKVLGNAALEGAAQMLMDRSLIQKTRQFTTLSRHVDLGGNPVFNTHYMDQMFFPEA